MRFELKRIHNWIMIVLLGLLVVLCLLSMRFTSPTSDEQNHISRGYHYLVTGNLDLNVAPPFVNALSAVPLLLYEDIIIPSYDLTHIKTYINQFADEFVWVYNDAERIVNGGRLAIVFLSALLGYFVFRWARELWGVQAGLLALFLYALAPNILAHSQLVTTDLGVACLIFVASYFLWRFLRRRRNVDLALAGVMLGLAQATKFSALLLMPIFAVILLVEIFVMRDYTLQGRWPWRARFSQTRWAEATYFCCAVGLVLACFAFLSFWSSYGFETAPLSAPKPVHATVDRFVPYPALRQVMYRAVEIIRVPFPTYFRGLRWLQRYSVRGAPAFLMGSHSHKGWWYYFLVAFAIKTPVPTLILFTAAMVLTLRDRHDAAKREYVLYVPIVFFFVATFFSFLNIGYRHILPVLPFVFVAASKVITWARRRWIQVALALVCLWYAVGTISVYPHYLAFFNEVVGGPENGYKYLVDSNLDWGQDLKNLRAYMDENGLEKIYLAYFGSAHIDYYGIETLPVPADKPEGLNSSPSEVYAISATYLQGGYLGDTEAFSWLRQNEPFAKIGYSIFLYRLP
jgi:hypothetical protein